MLNCYLDGDLLLDVKEEVEAELRDQLAGLKPEEAAVLILLKARLERELDVRKARKSAGKKTPRRASATLKA